MHIIESAAYETLWFATIVINSMLVIRSVRVQMDSVLTTHSVNDLISLKKEMVSLTVFNRHDYTANSRFLARRQCTELGRHPVS
jgi:hypothetical protein